MFVCVEGLADFGSEQIILGILDVSGDTLGLSTS